MAPQLAYLKYVKGQEEGIAVSFFGTSSATLQVKGQDVKISQTSDYPRSGKTGFVLEMSRPAAFGVWIRIPPWAGTPKLEIADGKAAAPQTPTTMSDGWLCIAPRDWKNGDGINITFSVGSRLLVGEYTNKGSNALAWGPLVLAYDEARNKDIGPAARVALVEGLDGAALTVKPVDDTSLAFTAMVRKSPDAQPQPAVLVPYAEAGSTGGKFRVWLRTSNAPATGSLLSNGVESRSRPGNLQASITDGEYDTHVVTFSGGKAEEDWYAVTLDSPVTIRRIVFAHGHCFRDGGWFDASGNKPMVQVQREKNGKWENVGTLAEYPATTAADSKGLNDGQRFTLKLAEPAKVFGVRVVGKPASGNNDKQSFSSCAELEAFGE